MHDLPRLGVGLGYRLSLHDDILANADRIDFLEFVSDQYLYAVPEPLDRLDRLGERFTLIPHGVGMSVGTAAPLDPDYLDRLRQLVSRTRAPWFSDHLSFAKVPDIDIEQLTPLWFTHESLDAVCHNVRHVKSLIDCPFLLENITYYFPIPDNDMTETEFITRVLEDTDTGLLLDINNVWVNSVNHDSDPYEFLAGIPLHRTVQMHIAGGRRIGNVFVDTHGAPVRDEVWDLLRYVLDRAPVKAILLEWDHDWPEFGVLLDHLERARAMFQESAAAGVTR